MIQDKDLLRLEELLKKMPNLTNNEGYEYIGIVNRLDDEKRNEYLKRYIEGFKVAEASY